MQDVTEVSILYKEKLEKVVHISLKSNLLTPYTQLVVRNDNSSIVRYSYSELISPHVHQVPCSSSQDISEDPKHSSCPPLSLRSSQGGELLVTGSQDTLSLGPSIQATQDGSCCWMFYTEPHFTGEREQFCGEKDILDMDRVGSVKFCGEKDRVE